VQVSNVMYGSVLRIAQRLIFAPCGGHLITALLLGSVGFARHASGCLLIVLWS
jgi:hypothetical protein